MDRFADEGGGGVTRLSRVRTATASGASSVLAGVGRGPPAVGFGSVGGQGRAARESVVRTSVVPTFVREAVVLEPVVPRAAWEPVPPQLSRRPPAASRRAPPEASDPPRSRSDSVLWASQPRAQPHSIWEGLLPFPLALVVLGIERRNHVHATSDRAAFLKGRCSAGRLQSGSVNHRNSICPISRNGNLRPRQLARRAERAQSVSRSIPTSTARRVRSSSQSIRSSAKARLSG
jgi:hypothetical protein